MKVLILNGSPRKNGNISELLAQEKEKIKAKNPDCQFFIENVSELKFNFCSGCMSCRSKGKCIYPYDDAHRVAEEINDCQLIIVGTPVYWGNMNGKLKCLFDRMVGVLMKESKFGIPLPMHKGKKAIIVTSCTTPFPFNYLCGQTSGAIRSLKEILKSSGFRVIKTINRSNTKKQNKIIFNIRKVS